MITHKMTNTSPKKRPSLHVIDDDDSTNINTTHHVGKRGKVREFLGILKSKTEDPKNKTSNQSLNAGPTPQATNPHLLASQASGLPIVASQPKDANSDDNMSISSYAPSNKHLPSPTRCYFSRKQ
ncbi:hypothetical protein BGX24_008191 [Mortierella sp. AD032]|nr:hypothetical protein BGX24_008191 [Mortierella sp. AD032]